MKKQLLSITAGITLALNSFAQLGTFSFSHTNGNSCSSPILTVTSQPANASFSAFSRNTVSCQNEANVMNSKGWTASTSINTSYYLEFSVTANPGYVLNLTKIDFTHDKNNHGPEKGRIAHNFSGDFTTNTFDFFPEDSPSNESWNFTDITTSAGGTVTFRIYGWKAQNASSGTMYVDEVKLYGTVVVPPPTANAGSDIDGCTGSSAITMTGATATGGYSAVAWSGGSGSGTWSGTGTNPATYQFTPSTTSGSFTATLTVTGSGIYTGTNPTSTRTISWGTSPTANAGPAIVSCTGLSNINVTGASAGGTYSGVSWTYTPSSGSGSISAGANTLTPTFTPSSVAGSGTLTLTVTGSGSCAGTNPTSVRTITWATTGTWTGGTDNNWFTTSNWCGMPDANTDATILSGTSYQPNINADGAVCRNLTINSGASVTTGIAGRLQIKGNLVNNGSADLGSGTVVFNGANPQNITGNNNFANLEIDNSMMVGVNSGTQTITGIVVLTNGVMYTYGNPFILKSNASGIAQISGAGNGDLEGTLTAERYIPAAPAFAAAPFNHLIASPLKTDTIVDTGLSGFADDFSLVANSYGSSPNGTFFSFLESAGGAGGSPFSYNCLRAPSQIVNFNGYAAKITGATTLDITGTYKHHVSPIKNLSYTPGSGGNGWNLVGNPYPSSIDWNATNGWVKQHITNSIYLWDPATEQFTSYNGTVGTNGGTRYIAPFQAFFVVANDYFPMISAMQTSRVTSATTFYKTDEVTELIRLKVTNSNGQQDETVVYFDLNGSQDLDVYDSYKIKSMSPTVPMLASRLGNENISINVLPGYTTETVIPLIFESLAGNFSITAAELLGFGNGNPVYLQDAYAGTITEITENFQYDFTASDNDENRFAIVFNSPMITSVNENEKPVKFYESNGQIIIEGEVISGTNSQFSMYNSAGQTIISSQQVQLAGGRCAVSIPELADGIYIVKLQNGNTEQTGRIYISKAPIF
ncbi:MAG: hypothetical protein POELPBGB_00520 [Bacteroidia bacterium]|nr:hypothetical protein [Bacteroidia bacterium]